MMLSLAQVRRGADQADTLGKLYIPLVAVPKSRDHACLVVFHSKSSKDNYGLIDVAPVLLRSGDSNKHLFVLHCIQGHWGAATIVSQLVCVWWFLDPIIHNLQPC